MKLNKSYTEALIKKYEAEIAEAEAGLGLYLSKNNMVAVSEHIDFIKEQDLFLERLVSAKDKLNALKEFIKK